MVINDQLDQYSTQTYYYVYIHTTVTNYNETMILISHQH